MNKAGDILSFIYQRCFSSRKVRRRVAFIFFYVIFSFIAVLASTPQQVDLVEGEVATEEVYSPKDLEFEDVKNTELRRNEAAQEVDREGAYELDEQKTVDTTQSLTALLDKIMAILANPNLTRAEQENQVNSSLNFQLLESDLEQLMALDSETWVILEQNLVSQIRAAMKEGLRKEDWESAKNQILDAWQAEGYNQAVLNLVQNLLDNYLLVNESFNETKYAEMQKSAKALVDPIMLKVRDGEKIVGNGDVVTSEDILKLEALGMTKSLSSWISTLGICGLVLLLMIMVIAYIRRLNPGMYERQGYLYLLGLIILIFILIAEGVLSIDYTTWPEMSKISGYLMPFGAAAMLIAILMDNRLSILVIAIVGFLLAYISNGRVEYSLVGFVGGFVGIISVNQLKRRRDLMLAGFNVAAATAISIIIIGFIDKVSFTLLLGEAVFFGAANGLLSSVLTFGLLGFLENLFGITSVSSLTELSLPSRPLLKKLMTEAPGTYHHSVMVANLAESATEEVGGDGLLARVGAYYHDIGKIQRPYFFIENQVGENPHDKIAPSLSALILISHVRDGLEMAKENGLPQIIQDMIVQHHGNSRMEFFYRRAVEEKGIENVQEEDFRYPGPKPKTREAAIIMLADTVEAAVRSMKTHKLNRMESLVRKIIQDKLLDGQLDDCDLSFKDLEVITNCFLQILGGMFHERIEYPELTAVQGGKNGNLAQ